MTPPRLCELRCPSCQRTSWDIDSDDRGMEDDELPYEKRSYDCPHCAHNGPGWSVLQQSPPAFFLQPSNGSPMTQAEFDHWVDILRTNFPDAPVLASLGKTFFPRPTLPARRSPAFDGIDERTVRKSIGHYLAGDVAGCIQDLTNTTPSIARPTRFRFLRRLFEFRDTHLVGFEPPPRAAVDQGSWVAPQLAVVLSRCDPQFVANAKKRIAAGCPVTRVSSAKALGTLLHVLRTIPAQVEWAEAASREPELQRLLQSEEPFGPLAIRWGGELEKRFAELALPLPAVSSSLEKRT